MVTKTQIEKMAAERNITVSYEYNPARSRYEATIGATHFRSLAEVRDFLLGL